MIRGYRGAPSGKRIDLSGADEKDEVHDVRVSCHNAGHQEQARVRGACYQCTCVDNPGRWVSFRLRVFDCYMY